MAVDMFMKIGDIKGEASDPAGPYADCIGVVSWTWGMTQTGSAGLTGPGTGTAKANVHDLSFTKYVDFATPNLMTYCCQGTPIATALLTCRKAGQKEGQPPLEYLKIELKDCMVSSVSVGGGGQEERLTEHVTINFHSYAVEYTKQGKNNMPGGSSKGKYVLG
jgi:type VI secretion system secreted protein Hcp